MHYILLGKALSLYMFLTFIHVVAYIGSSFLTVDLKNNHCKYSEHWVWHIRSPCQIGALPLTSPGHPERGRAFEGSQMENKVNSSARLKFENNQVLWIITGFHRLSLERTALYIHLPLSFYTPSWRFLSLDPSQRAISMSPHPEMPPLRGMMGKWVGIRQQEENLLMETISVLNFSYMIVAVRISFSKLEKFHSLDSMPLLGLLSSVQTFYPAHATEFEELYSCSGLGLP